MYAVGCSSLVTTLGSVVNPEDNNIMMLPKTVRGLANRKLTYTITETLVRQMLSRQAALMAPLRLKYKTASSWKWESKTVMGTGSAKGANINHPLNWLMFGLNGAEIVFNFTTTIDGLNLNSKP
ncbi:uncharacterized protein LOC107884626 [Acyrthosiphon pisum]|uniref:Uncharacterized protein n=1 Tax=Acyrthosiphon pisum TaxID=7029 RepID=A0A8R2HAC5_ACYPI|nr:uncharacterized protein LOC107884626 [Acyrthosiphon pisum]|eukprot:XP_016662626.1 PREDICTED: uncharacterized protein LOC107884626 [Acyrthosiphon pisum]